MKVVIRRAIFSILIISAFVASLSFMKPEIKEEELLAYVDLSDTTVEVRKTTSEIITSETTTTTSVATTTVTTTTTKKSITPGIGEIKGNVDSYYLSLLNKELNIKRGFFVSSLNICLTLLAMVNVSVIAIFSIFLAF